MNLSPHFEDTEFEPDGPFPADCMPLVTQLCEKVLEPIRLKFGPIVVTSGYRDSFINAKVHGVIQSQHEYTPTQCAADWYITAEIASRLQERPKNLRDVFDWIRLKSGLPVDEVILEHGENGYDVIHTSFTPSPRQEALEGLTGNRSGYMRWNFKPGPSAQS